MLYPVHQPEEVFWRIILDIVGALAGFGGLAGGGETFVRSKVGEGAVRFVVSKVFWVEELQLKRSAGVGGRTYSSSLSVALFLRRL